MIDFGHSISRTGLIRGSIRSYCGFIGGGFHKVIRNPHRNIEIVQIIVVSFAEDKFHDIRVVHLKIAILAPRRVPPCLTCSVAVLKIFINETGPEATPPVVPTMLFFGRNGKMQNPYHRLIYG